jgi:hypothetical protein
MLRRWLRYYGGQLGAENLLVVDHGSDDGSTDKIAPASRIRLPRTPFDDGKRADLISELASGLLRYYDVVMYTDTDEMLVADPDRFTSLKDYVSEIQTDAVRATGFEVFHNLDRENALDDSLPILSQRNFAQFSSAYCKPLIHRSPVHWRPGFHACNKHAPADPSLLLFHLRSVDQGEMLNRLETYRKLAWSKQALEAGWSRHLKASSDEAIASRLRVPINRLERQGGPVPFDPATEAMQYNSRLSQAGEVWRVHPAYTGDVHQIPERMRALF